MDPPCCSTMLRAMASPSPVLATFAYIVTVAITHDPRGPLALFGGA